MEIKAKAGDRPRSMKTLIYDKKKAKEMLRQSNMIEDVNLEYAHEEGVEGEERGEGGKGCEGAGGKVR